MDSSVHGTPHKNKGGVINKESTPHTPKRLHHSRFPLSSPYSGKSPIPIPILLPSQYGIGNSENRSSGRFTDSGFVNKKIGYNNDLTNQSIGINENLEENNQIELFNKTLVGQTQYEIPPVGIGIENLPFFNFEKSTLFVNSIQKIFNSLKSLKKVNDTIVDMNESLGAYLFGLFENAWCVNLSEDITLESIEKIEQIKKLQNEISELENEIEVTKQNSQLKEQRRKSTMPPPSIRRISNIGTNRMIGSKRQIPYTRTEQFKRRRTKNPIEEEEKEQEEHNQEKNDQKVDLNSKKRTFLKAGSRNATFKSRIDNKRSDSVFRNNSRGSNIGNSDNNNNNNNNNLTTRKFGNGLNLSYATKIQTIPLIDDSISDLSGSDTSEVQTLSNIQHTQRSNTFERYSNIDRNNSRNNNKQNTQNSWEVKHRKPFR
ncbi:hypothetical protein C6P40_002424 [Pichia californica]|uniref:DASH complex subunit DAM1 n=1 Tax=Pichia californica TaxID=460514 RepID=A0A9P6WP26_9ASCO|nr:hypothetical protein C6P42_002848 [[Candida] californica]KAG0690554.1 hypothetical protein C6P40_002424 [[Candida] californica]